MSGGAKWKVFPSDPWRLATGDVLQGAASPPWGWSLTMCALAGKLREKLAAFPQEICCDRFSYKCLWTRASLMRLNTPTMSPQTDAVSLCGHINIKQIIMKSTVESLRSTAWKKMKKHKCLIFPFLSVYSSVLIVVLHTLLYNY